MATLLSPYYCSTVIIIILSILTCTSVVIAQSYLWYRTMNIDSETSHVHALHITNEGKIVGTGMFTAPQITFDKFNVLTNRKPYTHESYVVEFNASGTAVWARSISSLGR